jgi:hypothetical protein
MKNNKYNQPGHYRVQCPSQGNSQEHQLSKLFEGLERHDLKRLVSTRVTIDEYKSKIGSDEEIVVIGFKVDSKEPALDLVSFVEKSYDWVVDADTSSGEISDGSYIVFIETERTTEIAENIMQLLKDLEHLTDIKNNEWHVEYYKPQKHIKLDLESLRAAIPTSPEEYRMLFKNKKDDIDKLKTAAGVEVNTKAPKNDFTESLRVMAGIR